MDGRWLSVLLAVFLAAGAVVGCGCGDDDDDDSGDDSPDDDDADDDSADDDADDDANDDDASDDDTGDDDDDADDDTGDDDTGMEARLLLMGEDDERVTSWLETGKGWAKYPIPPSVTPGLYDEFGPSFVAEGAIGHAVWNVYGDAVSNGHDWLYFTPETGWAHDSNRGQAGGAHVVETMFAPAAGTLWSVSRQIMLLDTEDTLYRFIGSIAAPQLGWLPDKDIRSVFFLHDGLAFVSGYSEGEEFLFQLNGTEWFEVPMPAAFVDGAFTWIWLGDAQHGWAVWEAFEGGRKLVSFDTGVISEVDTPAGCEGNSPTQVFGVPDLAIALDRSGPDHRFWEMRDGDWSCRDIGGEQNDARVAHAVVLPNGRAFLAAWSETEPFDAPMIFEVLEDSLVDIAPPDDMATINGLHIIGDDAPAHSMLVAP
ncbi:MAG: hypothetical protein M5R36_07375 [Deltaproteobacteria bacterium]|nr:hypothetical protein [Deltaproteobacteria bacterium]